MVMTSYNIGVSTTYDREKQNDQLWSFVASSESVKGGFKPQTLKEPKLVQLDNVPMIIKKS
jgi:hypothetical protein